MIRRLNTYDVDFAEQLTALLTIPENHDKAIRRKVQHILDDIKFQGDEALLALSNQFDKVGADSVAELEVPASQLNAAPSRVDPLVLDGIQTSISRVNYYHEQQKVALGGNGEWSYEDEQGNRLGQIVRPMQRVGIYVPGGKACYPSTIIMTAIPAKVAGVKEVILTVPTPNNEVSDVLLATAALCGVERMFRVGGAQAIGALAFGTDTIPKVDKIVGPGNIYVTTAKELLFGKVGIDRIAGPSEVVIIADESTNPDWLVMDMFAQAEHDELAQAILISTSHTLLEDVARRLPETLLGMSRVDIISASIRQRGALIYAPTLTVACDLVNRIAPEHLELAVSQPEAYLTNVQHAGAIFIGAASAEVIGDYTAGPSHVLPTSGSARFASPLGIYDFQVRSSLIQCSVKGSIELSRTAAILATEEGLEAHSRSAAYRLQD